MMNPGTGARDKNSIPQDSYSLTHAHTPPQKSHRALLSKAPRKLWNNTDA
jgi:hypothetical protein